MRARWLLVPVTLVALALGVAFLRERITTAEPKMTPTRLFEQVFAKVRSAAVDPLGEQELYRRAAAGIIEELDDPYAVLTLPGEKPPPPEDAPVAPGFFLDRRDGLAVVVATLPGSPADAAGLLPGDRLLAIDSASVDPNRLDQVAALLDGKPGSTMVLRVRRTGTAGSLALSVVRGSLPPGAALESALLDGGIARISVRRFEPATADSVRERLASLQARGARALVLDLRSAVGGGSNLERGVALADLFLDPGAMIAIRRARPPEVTTSFVDHSRSPFAMLPLAVLIDGGTAGAAEVVAGALQDHDRAAVFGSNSFGRGVTQSVFRLGEGASLSLTTSLWITPSGRQIQRPPRAANGDTTRLAVKSDAGRVLLGGGGIVPDRQVSGGAHEDLALEEARRVLLRAGSPAEVLAMLSNKS